MKFTDQIKAKAEELELSKKLDSLGSAAKEALSDAKSKAGEVAHDSKAKVEGLLDKAGTVIDERTDGKYADTVAKVKTKAGDLVDKVASHRPGAEDAADEAATDVTDAAAEADVPSDDADPEAPPA